MQSWGRSKLPSHPECHTKWSSWRLSHQEWKQQRQQHPIMVADCVSAYHNKQSALTRVFLNCYCCQNVYLPSWIMVWCSLTSRLLPNSALSYLPSWIMVQWWLTAHCLPNYPLSCCLVLCACACVRVCQICQPFRFDHDLPCPTCFDMPYALG